MSSILARLAAVIARIAGWFRPLRVLPPPALPLPAPSAELPPPTPPLAHAAALTGDMLGTFYFRETILDQLGRYFRLMRRMRAGDPDAYDLHSQIGAFIVPQQTWRSYNAYIAQTTELAPIWRKERPSFGMVMFGAVPDHAAYDGIKKSWLPAAIYFRKYDKAGVPPDIQPTARGDVYAVTVYWDKIAPDGNRKERRSRRTGAPTEFPVVIDAEGRVGLLKTMNDEPIIQREKHGRRRGELFAIPHRVWGNKDFFVSWAGAHGQKVDAYLCSLFIDAANILTEAAMAVIRVRVTHDGLAALFAVDVLRTPYFFRDRDATVTASGAKRRIFHIVRTHERVRGAKQSFVRTHFRGERAFRWKGYGVEITVPGRDHLTLFDADFGGYDESKINRGEAHSSRYVGGWLRRLEKQGVR